jgi:hypothetical protein
MQEKRLGEQKNALRLTSFGLRSKCALIFPEKLPILVLAMQKSNNSGELNTAESLEVARAYAGLIGEIPSSFSSTLRVLITDEEKHGGALSSTGRYLATRLLKSRGVLSAMYYGALTFREEKLNSLGGPSLENLTKSFSPMELAGLIGLLYLYRRVRSFSAPALWSELQPRIRAMLEMGGHVGAAIPRIGLTMGTFVGCFTDMTLCLFQKQDEKAFKEYRRHLKSSNLPYDLPGEMALWGCTRFNVGSVLLQMLGFGVATANAYSQGLSCEHPLGEGLIPEAYRFKICAVWIEALLNTGAVPEMTHRGEFYPTQAASAVLLREAAIVKEKGTKHAFIEKTKEDVSPEKTPFFFPDTPPAKEPEEAPAEAAIPPIKDEDLEKI